jgi:hypothetical protein
LIDIQNCCQNSDFSGAVLVGFSAAQRLAVARIADPPIISTPSSLTIIRRLAAKQFNVSDQSARRFPVNPADDLVDDFFVYTADLVGAFLVDRADVIDAFPADVSGDLPAAQSPTFPSC